MRALTLLWMVGCTSPDAPDEEAMEVQQVCGQSTDLLEAPEPLETSAGTLAPVDILDVVAAAVVRPDGVTITSTVRFLVGEQEGRAVLEFGPEAIAPSHGLSRITVSDPPRELVIVDEDFERCSEQTLTVTAELPLSWMDVAGEQTRLEAHEEGLFWSAGLQDSEVGRFLGMWTPSNLLFDAFDLQLSLDVSALEAPHEFHTTGVVEPTPEGWQVQWTQVRAHAPLWVLSPTAITLSETRVVATDGGDITIDLLALPMDAGRMEEAGDRAESALQQFSEEIGTYHHGERYLLWLRNDQTSSMEFDGGTVTALGAVEHEVMHSWFGRGASPVSDRDGWLDEAMTSYMTEFYQTPLGFSYDSAPLNLLIGDNRWAGAELGIGPYLFGGAIFAGLAHDHGVDEMQAALAGFYEVFRGRTYSTEQAEEFFTCWFDDDEVRQLFAHRAYGDASPVGPRPEGWCSDLRP